MKTLIALLLAIVLSGLNRATADNQPPGTQTDEPVHQVATVVPRGKATRYGLFQERGKGWVRDNPNSSTGKIIRKPTLEFVEQTGRIPLRKGIYFGYKYWLKIEPDKSRADLRRVLIHPEMTLPDGSTVSRSERAIHKHTTHGIVTALDGYALIEDYELVEGDWIFQLWYRDELLVEQKFTTYWPDQESQAVSGAAGAGG